MESNRNNPTILELEEQMEMAQERPSAGQQCLHYSRLFIQFLFSYVGLTAILVAYLFMGAFVFLAIEHQSEGRNRESISKDIIKAFQEIHSEANTTNITAWTLNALSKIKHIHTSAANAQMYDNWYDIDSTEFKWTFFGSFLFSLTVLSTIGYGHITPVTVVGQLFCIVYALIGMPLMLLVLTNVGRVLANSARLLYLMYSSRFCQKLRCNTRKKRKGRGRSSRKRGARNRQSVRGKSIKRSNSKKRPLKKVPTQTVIHVDSDDKSPKTRPVSLNVEIRNTSGPRLPPSYDESNEMEERLSDNRESAISYLSEKSRKSTLSRQRSLPSPISEERTEGKSSQKGNGPIPKAGIAVIDETTDITVEEDDDDDDDCLLSPDEADTAKEEEASASEDPRKSCVSTISKDASSKRKVEFSATPYRDSPKGGVEKMSRQRSCIEFGQLDRESAFITVNREQTLSSVSEVTPTTHNDTLSPEDTLSLTQSDMQPSLRSDIKSITSLNESARSMSTRSHDTSRITTNSSFQGKKTKRKWVLMKPPTLKTLHRSKRDLKLIDKSLAIRLANYDKMLGSSRQDLASAIPEFTCCENSQLLNEVAEKGFDQLMQPLLNSKGKSRGRKKLELDDSDCDSDSSTRSTREIQVSDIPITPVILFFFGYIVFGGILFSRLEPRWNFFQSFYFCFITLTTIGFGDFVPDHSLANIIACCVYTMVGMAVTSMCIALMMKKFVTSVKKIAIRVGVMEDEDL